MLKTTFNIFIGLIIGYYIGLYIFSEQTYHGPNSKNIIETIYKYENKYYKFIPEVCVCPIC